MKILIRAVFCFALTFLKSQTRVNQVSVLEVKYNFKYLADTLDARSIISEPMVLLTNNQTSIYYSENKKIFDEGFRKQIDAAIKTGSVVEPGKLPIAKVRHSVYKKDQDVYISNYLVSHLYTYASAKIVWQIDPSQTKDISGYRCTKATTRIDKRNYIAWFTYDIPISDGPYKFKGLPGLILSLYDEHNYFEFEMLSISKTALPIEYRKGIPVTQEQYVKKRNEYINDPSQGKMNTPEYRKRIEDNKKKYNNFLEN
ncbi:GLPGLI family protein [uncultured Chryseobacterium sp.]|jgi:Protein of unknown function (Porph_ging).|uniref:GLPGLI family protein n=1 Tax=uncultured Chryseobacterium sp. TaxID=259322 RepID=UPI002609F162|nr:GLPGLI family protein [uncultured Chryseobacterium sp.]